MQDCPSLPYLHVFVYTVPLLRPPSLHASVSRSTTSSSVDPPDKSDSSMDSASSCISNSLPFSILSYGSFSRLCSPAGWCIFRRQSLVPLASPTVISIRSHIVHVQQILVVDCITLNLGHYLRRQECIPLNWCCAKQSKHFTNIIHSPPYLIGNLVLKQRRNNI